MRFGFVTDELSLEPRRALEMALQWGVRDFEIRQIREARFPRVPDRTIEELIALRREYGVRFSAVSPGFFRGRVDDEQTISYALGEGLERCIAFMEACSIRTLIVFGFLKEGGDDETAVRYLRALADRLDEFGLNAAVENEANSLFDGPERIAGLLERIGRPNMGANWDLANLIDAARAGFPQGYERLRHYIFNVHAKDVVPRANGRHRWVPIGEGICDWHGQMRALHADGVVECVTIESHVGPPEAVARHNLRVLQTYIET